MEKVGYKVIYDQTYGVAQTNFDQNVIAMKNAGVKILFVDSMAESYASGLLKSLQSQDFHPIVVLGAATYTNKLIPDSGGPSAVNGDYLQQSTTLYLGQDASHGAGGGELPPLGQHRLARVHPRPLHPLRVAVGPAVRPGTPERRARTRAAARC